ncbi:MAG: ERF family protein [Gemmatimonadetes bacterium]|jgi:hypothetical protein|nr:ERF family protein [Gemmatimonadota bacterium]
MSEQIQQEATLPHSEQIDQLATALALAQRKMPACRKDSKNPHLKSRYTDLTELVDATRPVLTEQGLSVVQSTRTEPGTGRLLLVTMLMHNSGQWLRGEAPVESVPTKGINASQALGSALTYMRRYTYGAMIGAVSEEDDDGHAAAPLTQQGKPRSSAPSRRQDRPNRVEGGGSR